MPFEPPMDGVVASVGSDWQSCKPEICCCGHRWQPSKKQLLQIDPSKLALFLRPNRKSTNSKKTALSREIRAAQQLQKDGEIPKNLHQKL